MKKYLIFIFTILIFLTLAPVPLSAKVKKNKDKDSVDYVDEDLSLREIRTLIRETNYDEAMRRLTIYIPQNPENFDNAQHLVAMIMAAKKRYAEKLDELIVMISTDPDNDEKIYEIVKALKKIEKNPSDSSLAYVDNIDKVVTFSHNQKEIKRILENSSQLVAQKDFINAVLVNTEGFSLYREEYDDRWGKNSDIIKETDEIVSELNNVITLYQDEEFNEQLNNYIVLFSQQVSHNNYTEAQKTFNKIDNALIKYYGYRTQIYEIAIKFDLLNQRLVNITNEQEEYVEVKNEDSAFFDTTDASYLPFMTHFIRGNDSIPESGILNAMDAKYFSMLSQMNHAIYSQLEKNYNNYNDFLERNINSTVAYSLIEKSVENIKASAILGKEIAKLPFKMYSMQSDFDETTYENPLKNSEILNNYVLNLTSVSENIYKVNYQINDIEKNQEVILTQLSDQNLQSQKSILVNSLFDSSAELGNLVGVKNDQVLENYSWSFDYLNNNFTQWNKLSELYSKYLDKVFDDSSRILNEGWQKIADYYIQASEAVVAEVDKNFECIKTYTEGRSEKIGQENHDNFLKNINLAFDNVKLNESSEGDKYRYPDIARLMVIYNLEQIKKAYDEINGYENVINDNYGKHEQWKSDDGITEVVELSKNHIKKLKEKLNQLQLESDSLRNVAVDLINQSEKNKSDAEYNFEQAERALRNENFSEARSNLKKCSNYYVKAFDFQTDDRLNQLCDEKIIDLGMRINRKENERVVIEVREAINQARISYNEGRFEDADRYLTLAASRWADTNSEENEEITNFQVFVNTAMTTKNGRVVLPSAAQYEEMTQLLAIAYEYYDSGCEKLSKGLKTESEEDFNNSEVNIDLIKSVYPHHQEAALLSLKISKLRDPQKFNKEFSQKIEDARKMLGNKDKRTEGYQNIEDYYKLDPTYKGLKDIYKQARIAMGLDKKVERSSVNQANEFYAEARRLYNSGKLEEASAKIAQSLTLNPEDKNAIALKDRITTAIGGTKIPLTTEAQKLYSLSYDSYVQDNYDMANFYLQKLEKLNVRFMNDDDVKRLKEKIDAHN